MNSNLITLFPSFLILGVQKAGTSALFFILKQHPKIIAPTMKEIHYFDEIKIKYGNDLEYLDFFKFQSDSVSDQQISYEATPSYFYNELCPKRIFDFSPEMKFVLILRDPVERAFSSWNMYRNFGLLPSEHKHSHLYEPRSFDDIVQNGIAKINQTNWTNDQSAFIKRGLYIEQLKRYLKYFRLDQFHIINYQELIVNFDSVMKGVCDFVHINNQFVFQNTKFNMGNYANDEISAETKQRLINFYKPFNNDLSNFLNRDFHFGYD